MIAVGVMPIFCGHRGPGACKARQPSPHKLVLSIMTGCMNAFYNGLDFGLVISKSFSGSDIILRPAELTQLTQFYSADRGSQLKRTANAV